MRRHVLAITCVIACRHPSSTQQPTEDAQPIAPITSAAPDAAATVRRPGPREIALAWNSAHVQHDAKALEGLYAPRVDFYGTSLSGRQCAERKKAAFAKAPDYDQSIRDVRVEVADAGAGAIVSFTKTSTTKGKSTDYPAILVIVGDAITAETDKISEANLAAQRRPKDMWCVEDGAYPPNDRVIAPYKISASQAYQRARRSPRFKQLEVDSHGDFLDFGQVWCPTDCVHGTSYDDATCGYKMRLENHSELQRRANESEGFSILVEWVYVDAVDGTMVWQGGAKERLPD